MPWPSGWPCCCSRVGWPGKARGSMGRSKLLAERDPAGCLALSGCSGAGAWGVRRWWCWPRTLCRGSRRRFQGTSAAVRHQRPELHLISSPSHRTPPLITLGLATCLETPGRRQQTRAGGPHGSRIRTGPPGPAGLRTRIISLPPDPIFRSRSFPSAPILPSLRFNSVRY